ncbi:Cytochrome P450 [Streptomyces sp. MnatMP-M77]|uniref:cytochrome P450 n=1 Tax=Streptomyces TaxID=1883 RepID=UPI000804A067|nr:cytochrome P450 [Streptomyces sp. MnatMP-M77]MYT78771.1 cytochrome P450 [Streptomyces sp. SID8364]SBU93398.1 Cytochrome P450 [Streptomyces sp. MnatMP-M77]
MSVDRTACPGQPSVPPGEGMLTHSRALRFWLDPANLAARLEQAGPVVPTRTGPATAFQVNDPALLRKIGTDEDTFRFWGPDPSLRDFTEDGVVGLEGAAHRKRRAVMRPAFSASRLTTLGPAAQARTRRLLAGLPADRPLDMRMEMSRLACGLLVSCVLNSELAPDTLSRIAAARSTLSSGMFWRYALAPWPWVPVPRRRACRRALAELDEAVRQLLARHQPHPDGRDLVSVLEAATPENPRVVQRDVRALLIAGMETSASTLAWACYELGRHPHYQQALRDEADAAPDPSRLQADQLPLATAFVQEVTRLHGIPFLVRRTRHQTVQGGVRIPAGAVVTLPLGALRRDRDRYRDPDAFDPKRWLPHAEPPPAPTALLAYGLGPRYCPGAAAADAMLPVALATLAGSRTLRPARPNRKIGMSLELTPTPKGLTMYATPR